jgi:hypothetical protein
VRYGRPRRKGNFRRTFACTSSRSGAETGLPKSPPVSHKNLAGPSKGTESRGLTYVAFIELVLNTNWEEISRFE